MAEAFLRHYAGDRYEAFSAGLEPQPIHPPTTKVMGEIGLNIHGQRSKHLREFLGIKNFKYVIIVCEQANKACPQVFPGLARRLFWPFDDPVAFQGTDEQILAKFREVRNQIKNKIKDWIEQEDNSFA